MRLSSFSSELIEGNPEFEEIQADDEQRRGANAIRQTVPTTSSSTTEPLATSQKPLERRVPAPTRNAALIPLPDRFYTRDQGLVTRLLRAGDTMKCLCAEHLFFRKPQRLLLVSEPLLALMTGTVMVLSIRTSMPVCAGRSRSLPLRATM